MKGMSKLNPHQKEKERESKAVQKWNCIAEESLKVLLVRNKHVALSLLDPIPRKTTKLSLFDLGQ